MLAAMNRRHTVADYLRPGRAAARGAARPRAVDATSSSAIPARPGPISPRRSRWSRARLRPGVQLQVSPPAPARRPPSRRSRSTKPEKDARLQELQALLRDQQEAFNCACVGLTVPVLFTGPGRHPGQVAGRSPWLQPVHAIGPASLIGTETPVTIAAAHPNSLSASPCHHRSEPPLEPDRRVPDARPRPRPLRPAHRPGRYPHLRRQRLAAVAARRP